MLYDIESPIVKELWERTYAGRKKKIFFCEGDSWFDYPMQGDPMRIANLALYAKDHGFIASKAHWGDEIIDMADNQVYDTASYAVSLDAEICCLFLSGGGNDLVFNNMQKYLINDPKLGYIDDAKLDGLLDEVYHAYCKIIDLFTRNKRLNCKYVFGHTYSYVIPDGRGYELAGIGVNTSWLKGPLAAAGCTNFNVATSVIKRLIDRFVDKVLERLVHGYNGANGKAKFGYSDLRGVLSSVPDWENELHPSGNGWGKVGKQFKTDFSVFFDQEC